MFNYVAHMGKSECIHIMTKNIYNGYDCADDFIEKYYPCTMLQNTADLFKVFMDSHRGMS